MKQIILLLALFITTFLSAQTKDVYVRINHMVEGSDFVTGQAYQTASGDFMLTRMQYYLSNFILVNDAGETDLLEDSYLLVDQNTSEYFLGSTEMVDHLEELIFYFGIDEPTNHADPSQYEADNPLAPQNPDMHWGWAAGYRFYAIEGKNLDSGANFEFHCVSDKYYKQISFTEIASALEIYDDRIVIVLDTDYSKIFEGVTIEGVYHGEYLIHDDMVANIQNNNVLKLGEAEVIEPTNINHLVDGSILVPNPFNANSIINLQLKNSNPLNLVIFNLSGQKIMQFDELQANSSFQIPTALNSGNYLFNFSQNGKVVYAKQVLVP